MGIKEKVILVPYPAQGHVTPMLKLASALLTRGLAPLLVLPDFIHRRISPQIEAANIPCAAISDGLELDEEAGGNFFAVEMAMENHMPLQLQTLLLDIQGDVACMVVDFLASYAINVGKACGVEVVGFWPAMLGTYALISSIPHMVQAAIIHSDSGIPLQEGPISLAPDEVRISASEMPWLIGTSSARKLRFKFWKRTLERSTTVGSLLVNTFPDECKHFPTGMKKIIPIMPLPLPLRVDGSFWEEDLSCFEWLDKRSPGSVIYISFGSWVSPIGEAKVKALATALQASRRPFLWALGLPWRKGLPEDFMNAEQLQGKGKVVAWAPQVRVLQHAAVGCYLTHCGWNSTMEAIECKKKMLCYPVAGDQFLNCCYIVNAWRIGARLSGFGKRDLEEGMKKVMEDSEMTAAITTLHQSWFMSMSMSMSGKHNHLTTFLNALLPIPK